MVRWYAAFPFLPQCHSSDESIGKGSGGEGAGAENCDGGAGSGTGGKGY